MSSRNNCTCGRFVGPSKPWSRPEGNCFECWKRYYKKDHPSEKEKKKLRKKQKKYIDNLYTCIHRGNETKETRPCKEGCSQGTLIPLLECSLFGSCTIHRDTKEVPCCKKCPSRSEIPPQEGRKGVLVPRAPSLSVTPTQSRALVTVAAGEEGKALFKTTRPLFENYAKRVGADLVVLDWEGHPAWPMSAKFAIPRALDHWERIAYVDADCLLLPDSPNLFEMCAEDEFGACDEITWHEYQPQHRRRADYLEFRANMGFKNVEKLPWMFNCGVMVVPRIYKHLLEPPTQAIIPHHCGEQDHTNARVLDAFLEGKCKVRLLDRRCNWQNWTDWGFEHAPKGAILHWSGGGKERKDRPAAMQEFLRKNPPSPPRGRKPFVIASSQRSGSTLLARTLREAGLGDVGELFIREFKTEASLQKMKDRGCVKIHHYQLKLHGLENAPLFEDANWIFLSRRNMLRQAVSLWKGRQTKAWTSEHLVQEEAQYNRDEITSCLQELVADVEGWEQYFAKFDIEPLPIHYEDLERDFEGTVRKILSFLGSENLTVPAPPLKKMADEQNEEWVRRYLSGQ